MTEVTRVPLQPIAKGSLTKLWLGIIVAVLVAAGVAWAAAPKGIHLETLTAGSGPHPTTDDVVFVQYTGKLDDGKVFDQSRPLPPFVKGIFPDGSPMFMGEGETIKGFQQGLERMQKGGHYELYIPSDLAYGATPPQGAPIPPNANLTFDMTVVDIMSKADFDRRVAAIQQMMQAQKQQGGVGAAGQ
ncbi:FKBP-type peptidyl-prolyl cis-trans isomerase [Tsuneonella mangrovi]|uniref:FKBP-type peptidyl-prolyl cis-trans isomerase n=1 Tax=Tsuneonella mangrovi TaxID=1982042 RepID=UPI000BA25A47|nr:FKBP-type peptidyl-prolyl cis-trans isomerase [Tsuneonella mangrovi]